MPPRAACADQLGSHPKLSDCLRSVLVLAHAYGIDLESELQSTMHDLEQRVTVRLDAPARP